MTDTVSDPTTASTDNRSFGWQALDSARDQRFTGALIVDVGEEIRLFFDLGVLYLAERATDPVLSDRLLALGVVTADDLERGVVHVGDIPHYGRLFDRVPTIDRDAVVTTIELMNGEIVGWMASREVLAAEALPYRHHPSGIQRWMDATEATDDVAPPTDADALPPPPPTSLPTPAVVPPSTLPAPSLPAPPPATPPTVEPPTVEPLAEPEPTVEPLADVIELSPLISTSEPTPDAPAEPTPIGPDAAADAVIAWTEPVDVSDPLPIEPLIQPLEVPGGRRRIDADEPATSDSAVADPTPELRDLAAMPNLPTGAERRAPRELAISTDWTAGLGLTDEQATDTTGADADSQPDELRDDEPEAGTTEPVESDDRDAADSSVSDLSIQIVWPSGVVDPPSSDDSPVSQRRPIERPTSGGSARLAVGRVASEIESIGDEPDVPPVSTAASDAVVFAIDWSLGALPPPAVVEPEEQIAAADVLDDVMHAVRRTVAACETRVARTQEATRAEPIGSLASLGGVMPAQPARSVFDEVMTPTFAGPSAGGQVDTDDRSGALRRLIGSLKRP